MKLLITLLCLSRYNLLYLDQIFSIRILKTAAIPKITPCHRRQENRYLRLYNVQSSIQGTHLARVRFSVETMNYVFEPNLTLV